MLRSPVWELGREVTELRAEVESVRREVVELRGRAPQQRHAAHGGRAPSGAPRPRSRPPSPPWCRARGALTLLSFTRAGELPLSKVGQRLQVHPASVTGVVDKLEQQGLVVRVPHPSDRRAVLARLTDEGRRVAAEATAALNEGPFGSLPLSGDEAEQLITVLARLRHAAGDY